MKEIQADDYLHGLSLGHLPDILFSEIFNHCCKEQVVSGKGVKSNDAPALVLYGLRDSPVLKEPQSCGYKVMF